MLLIIRPSNIFDMSVKQTQKRKKRFSQVFLGKNTKKWIRKTKKIFVSFIQPFNTETSSKKSFLKSRIEFIHPKYVILILI